MVVQGHYKELDAIICLFHPHWCVFFLDYSSIDAAPLDI